DDTSWASNMATVLAFHLPDITGTDDWRFIGWGKALELLNAVDSVAYATEIGNLITNLTGSQTGGYWPGTVEQGRVQNTAYAVMGLAAVGGTDAIMAAEAGADWLVAEQISSGDSTGGWLDPDDENKEYSYVDSEALQAIKAVLDISGSLSLSAAYIPQIGISVTPLAVDFGSLVPGVPSDPQVVTVTNTGNVLERFTPSIIDESVTGVYTTGLKRDDLLVVDWCATHVGVGDSVTISPLTLTVPGGTDPGTYTATHDVFVSGERVKLTPTEYN
ncbi:unnamed protein product, partial [marine sediment metagenome]